MTWLDFDTYGDRPDAWMVNNATANGLIDAVGGESDLNEWLSDNKYYRTRFERDYGDVKAWQNGYENYASPDDAMHAGERGRVRRRRSPADRWRFRWTPWTTSPPKAAFRPARPAAVHQRLRATTSCAYRQEVPWRL